MIPSGLKVMNRLRGTTDLEYSLIFKFLSSLGDKDLLGLKNATNTRASDFDKRLISVTRILDSLHPRISESWKLVVETAKISVCIH